MGATPALTLSERLADAYSEGNLNFAAHPFPINNNLELVIACQVYWIIFTLQWPAISIYALVGKE